MKQVTVLGARGFIGSHLAAELRRRGQAVAAPERDADLRGLDLGTAFYCIGVTADFRSRPFDTVLAHVCRLRDVLEYGRFDRLVYLSSTRLYAGAGSTAEEQPLVVNPADAEDLYNLSKAMGESLALHSGRDVRVVRLANVYGPDWESSNFLPSLIRTAVQTGQATLHTAPSSAKDYVSIDDVVDLVIRIAAQSQHRVYNLASGRNLSNAELAAHLQEVCGCTVQYAQGAPLKTFPPISVSRVQAEIGFKPRWLLDDLADLVADCREFSKSESK